MVIMRLSTIRNLYGGAGPWASVYLDATGGRINATQGEIDARRQLDLRWRERREELSHAGADEATLRAIDAVVRDVPAHGGPTEVAVLASGGTVAIGRTLPTRPRREAVSWSAQPHAADLIRAIGDAGMAGQPGAGSAVPDDEIRWVRADIDRTGARVTSHDGRIESVHGEDEFVTKNHAPGRGRQWSQSRQQRAAQTNWDQNSHEVARVVTEAVARTGADVVLLAGDERARDLVYDRLPPALPVRVFHLEHESEVRPHPEHRLEARRNPNMLDPILDGATQAAIESLAREREAEIIDRFHIGLSSGDSVRGLEPVCQAARDLRIDTLVLAVEPSHRQVWVDPHNPTMLGPGKRDTGLEDPVLEPADDALVGAAAFADANSIVIEADPELVDGVGAILRFPPSPILPI
jgi:hypothetical protein